ncbi:MAG: GNAT family protein [Polyangiaceae bacterium]
MIPHRITTPRTVIRCWQPQDAPLALAAIEQSLPELRPWMGWVGERPLDVDREAETLLGMRVRFDLGEDHIFGVFSPDESEVIGGTGLHARVGPRALEIGYWIRSDCTGRGLAAEVASALTRVAFERAVVDRVEIRCEPTNTRSAAVPRKLGFTHEATLRRRFQVREELRDVMVWSMFFDEYPESKVAQLPIHAFNAIGRPMPIAPAAQALK